MKRKVLTIILAIASGLALISMLIVGIGKDKEVNDKMAKVRQGKKDKKERENEQENEKDHDETESIIPEGDSEET